MKTRNSVHLFKGCMTLIVLLFIVFYVINIAFFLFPYIEAYSRWESTRPQAYTAIVEYGTDLGIFNISEEVVRNGDLVSSTTTFFDEPAIDRLYGEVRSCMLNPFKFGIFFCRVEYDPEYGYPRRLTINDWDLGDITHIAEFNPES